MTSQNDYVISRKIDLLHSVINRLLRRGAHRNLSKVINKTHPADLALLFRRHNMSEQIVLIDFDNRPRTREVIVQLIGE